MRVIDVYTATGLKFTVLPDRGMDIGVCTYKGSQFLRLKTGYVSPIYMTIEEMASCAALQPDC